MGHFISKKHKLIIYDAPKTGGTTIRSWIYFYLNNKLPDYIYRGQSKSNEKNIDYIHAPKNFLRELKGYKQIKFQKYSDSFKKICIYRDPVERFISCYNDKIISEQKWKRIPGMEDPLDMDGFFKGIHKLKPSLKWKLKRILGIGNDMRKNYINFHFETLTYHYGDERDYFDKIFDMESIDNELKNYLEDIFHLKLPKIHTRNSKGIEQKKIKNLDNSHIEKIIDMYKTDYSNGWVKLNSKIKKNSVF